ncbi:MAG: hypothetical protein ACI8RZ_006083 [Myxococcota bacterium]|jgi:hypothetical protein
MTAGSPSPCELRTAIIVGSLTDPSYSTQSAQRLTMPGSVTGAANDNQQDAHAQSFALVEDILKVLPQPP